MMLLAVQTGLRVSELIGLNCADMTLGDGANVRCEGKGRKHRTVPLTGPVINLIRLWLTERAGRPGDPLFCTRTGRRLSRDAVALRLRTHARNRHRREPSASCWAPQRPDEPRRWQTKASQRVPMTPRLLPTTDPALADALKVALRP
jgi:integrase